MTMMDLGTHTKYIFFLSLGELTLELTLSNDLQRFKQFAFPKKAPNAFPVPTLQCNKECTGVQMFLFVCCTVGGVHEMTRTDISCLKRNMFIYLLRQYFKLGLSHQDGCKFFR